MQSVNPSFVSHWHPPTPHSPPRMLAKDELLSLLQRCSQVLQQSKSRNVKRVHSQLEELLAKFKRLDGKLSKSGQSFVPFGVVFFFHF